MIVLLSLSSINSVSSMLSDANSLEKALRMYFIFIHVRTGHTLSPQRNLLSLVTSYKARYTIFWLFYNYVNHCERHSQCLQELISPVFLSKHKSSPPGRLALALYSLHYAHAGVERQIKTHDSVSCGQVQLVRACDRQACILQEPRKCHFHASVA